MQPWWYVTHETPRTFLCSEWVARSLDGNRSQPRGRPADMATWGDLGFVVSSSIEYLRILAGLRGGPGYFADICIYLQILQVETTWKQPALNQSHITYFLDQPLPLSYRFRSPSLSTKMLLLSQKISRLIFRVGPIGFRISGATWRVAASQAMMPWPSWPVTFRREMRSRCFTRCLSPRTTATSASMSWVTAGFWVWPLHWAPIVRDWAGRSAGYQLWRRSYSMVAVAWKVFGINGNCSTGMTGHWRAHISDQRPTCTDGRKWDSARAKTDKRCLESSQPSAMDIQSFVSEMHRSWSWGLWSRSFFHRFPVGRCQDSHRLWCSLLGWTRRLNNFQLLHQELFPGFGASKSGLRLWGLDTFYPTKWRIRQDFPWVSAVAMPGANHLRAVLLVADSGSSKLWRLCQKFHKFLVPNSQLWNFTTSWL